MKSFIDKPTREFRDRVLRAAESELSKYRQPNARRYWLWQFAGAAGLAAMAALVFGIRREGDKDKDEALAVGAVDPAMLNELALIEDLDLWQNLDLFENWPDKDV